MGNHKTQNIISWPARLKESQALAYAKALKMPRTRNNWSKPPIFVLHRSCQICSGQIRHQADAGGGRTIGVCLKPRCIKLVDIDAKAAMHKRFVPRQDVADDPLWAHSGGAAWPRAPRAARRVRFRSAGGSRRVRCSSRKAGAPQRSSRSSTAGSPSAYVRAGARPSRI